MGEGPELAGLVLRKRQFSFLNEEEGSIRIKNSRIHKDFSDRAVADLLYKDQDDDSFYGNSEDYYESLQTDPEMTDFICCRYCSDKVYCIKSNIVKCNIFASFSEHDSDDVLLWKCWNCKPKHRVIAVYITGRWWQTEDILTSSVNRENGWMKVMTFGERVILFVLNRIIFKQWEMDVEDVPYTFHSSKENAKLLWHNNVAIGFYTYKTKGTPVIEYCPYTWQMTAIDTIFIRKQYRRNGYGMSLLDDFRQSFPVEDVGLIQPVSQAMMSVCFKYLSTNPEERDKLWFIVPPAGETHRGNLWLEILGCKRRAERRAAVESEQTSKCTDNVQQSNSADECNPKKTTQS